MILTFMIDEYEHRYNEHKIALGSVKTAVPLSEEQLQNLEKMLQKQWTIKQSN